MSILEYDSHGTAKRLLTDITYINSVVGDRSFADFIKPADKVDYCCFPGSGGTDKGNLLSRFGIEADLVKNHFVLPVSERNMVEAYITF